MIWGIEMGGFPSACMAAFQLDPSHKPSTRLSTISPTIPATIPPKIQRATLIFPILPPWGMAQYTERPISCATKICPVSEPLFKRNGDAVAHLLADGLQDLAFYRQLVPSIAQRHKGTAKGNAVNLAARLDQPARPEKRHRLGPEDMRPATPGGTFLQLRGEGFVEHAAYARERVPVTFRYSL